MNSNRHPIGQDVHHELASRPAAELVNAMSVDVEDYYQVSAFEDVVARTRWDEFAPRVEHNTQRLLELFERGGVRATFFVLGCVAERHPALVRAIVDNGHELASHGYAHIRIVNQDAPAFRQDVSRAKALLEDLGGVAVRGYRAASFSINRGNWWAYDVLAETGHGYSSSVSPVRHDLYGIGDAPRTPFRAAGSGVVEIPVGTTIMGRRRMPLGGGFFRLLPYPWSRRAMRQVNRGERRPFVFYFHPWEIDPQQPRIEGARLRSRLRHYTNLQGMERKLQRLLQAFRWGRIDDVYGGDTGSLPTWPDT